MELPKIQRTTLTMKEAADAVYSLAENEMQLPFAVTLSSILSENEKVLLLDLQENSGLSQLMGEFYSSGMEELLVMAESGKYSKSRMVSCIGHLDRTDVVYPLGNTECLCEVKNLTYQKLFQILAQEMNYTTIVLNLGSRFMGFFELLGSCQKIFLMKSRGGLGQWREKEFLTEIQKRGEERLSENLREIQLPLVVSPAGILRRFGQFHFFAIMIHQSVFQRIEAKITGNGQCHRQFGRSNKGVCVRIAVRTFGKVAVEGGDDRVLPHRVVRMTFPLTDARTAGICHDHGADLHEVIHHSVSFGSGANLFGTRIDDQRGSQAIRN